MFSTLLVGPATLAIWIVHGYQGEVRGASPHLQMLLLVPVALACVVMYSLRSFFRRVEEEYHRITASAILASAFFAVWALGTVPMEEFYIAIDGHEGRRIYSDDSGMGYATGLEKVHTTTAVAALGGLVFGVAWGIITTILGKIAWYARPGR